MSPLRLDARDNGGATVRLPSLKNRTALLLVAAALAGCGTKVPEVTGLTVNVTFPGVTANQLELSVVAGSTVVLEPTQRPMTAGATLASPQSVSI
jgi:hypothetical protein